MHEEQTKTWNWKKLQQKKKASNCLVLNPKLNPNKRECNLSVQLMGCILKCKSTVYYNFLLAQKIRNTYILIPYLVILHHFVSTS